MADFQLNAGDSAVVTVTDTDDVTGDVVTPDAGSVTAVLSSTTDTIVENSDGTFTLTAGATDVDSVGNTVTVNATVNGNASAPGVGTYDVIATVVPPPDATTLTVAFGAETPPAAPAADGVNVAAAEEPGTFRNS